MRTKKRYLYLTETEWRVMLLALNRMRSKLIAQGRYTDAVDEIIIKMVGYALARDLLHNLIKCCPYSTRQPAADPLISPDTHTRGDRHFGYTEFAFFLISSSRLR